MDHLRAGTRLPTARYALAQMRRSAGRLVAAGVAVLVGTAFVTVAILAGDVITRTTYDAVAARFADADAVVLTTSGTWQQDSRALRATDGVAAVQPMAQWFLDLTGGGTRVLAAAIALPADHRLLPLTLASGAWPSAPGEIVLPSGLADRMKVTVGATIHTSAAQPDPAAASAQPEELQVTGISDDPFGAYTANGGAAVALPQDLSRWATPDLGDDPAIAVLLKPSAAPGGEPTPGVRQALATAVGGAATRVHTVDEWAALLMARSTGGQNLVFLVFVMTFAAVALLVAGLVIANTFQVLVAQRSHTLALLRCIGAGRGQIYRSVLLESVVLGLVASAAGVVTGVLVVQGALLVVPRLGLDVRVPGTAPVSPLAVLLPLVVGTVVTLLAALAPARTATRVAPLAALRPDDGVSLRSRGGRVRMLLATLAALGGFAALGVAIRIGQGDRPDVGLPVAVAGIVLSFVGVLVGAVFWLPRVVAALGASIRRAGPAARLATANTLRNPRRTAATSTALLIGVTLIVAMATGAAAARASAGVALDEEFPVDVSVLGTSGQVPAGVRDRVAAVDVVDHVMTVQGTTVKEPGGKDLAVKGADLDDLGATVRDRSSVARLRPGTILLTDRQAKDAGVEEGGPLKLTGDGTSTTLRVVLTSSDGLAGLTTRDDLLAVDPHAPVTEVWASLDAGADPVAALGDVQDALADEALYVLGPAAQRAQFEQIVDVMLGAAVGLLAVAVVIAVVGVANTLALSVIERRRESATLRAIGLSRSQVRQMLAAEGMLIALVGAVLGIVLGLLYGWAGAATALAVMGQVVLAVPWTVLLVVLCATAAAGLVASIAPARTILRTSPVEALAAD